MFQENGRKCPPGSARMKDALNDFKLNLVHFELNIFKQIAPNGTACSIIIDNRFTIYLYCQR